MHPALAFDGDSISRHEAISVHATLLQLPIRGEVHLDTSGEARGHHAGGRVHGISE